jgi:hypothetical protein
MPRVRSASPGLASRVAGRSATDSKGPGWTIPWPTYGTPLERVRHEGIPPGRWPREASMVGRPPEA